jgi:hypothetical protein
MTWHRAAAGSLIACILALGSGCAETVSKAARVAAPAAVQGSVKTARDPTTHDTIADMISDPRIRGATAQMAQAVTDGVLNSITEKQRLARAEAASDAFVEHMSKSLAASLRHDLGPAVSDLVADSVERTLDDKVEARLEVMARAVARGTVAGVADGWNSELGSSSPAMDGLVKQLARTAGREATLGFQDAVAKSTAQQKAGAAAPGDVLAAAGRASDSLLVAFRFAGWLLVLAVVSIATTGIVWSVRRLRRPPGSSGPRHTAHAG